MDKKTRKKQTRPDPKKKRFLVYFFRILGLLLLGAVVSVVIALSQINLDTLRQNIEVGLTQATRLPVKINGGLAWQFSLRPRIIMSDVHVANAEWATEKDLVKIDRIYAQLNLLSVFTGRPTIEALRVNGMTVNIERNAAGQYSFVHPSDDMAPQDNDAKGAEGADRYVLDFGKYGLESLAFADVRLDLDTPTQKYAWSVDRLSLDYRLDGDVLQYSGYVTKGSNIFPFVVSMSALDNDRKVYPLKIALASAGQPIVADVALEMTSMVPIDFIIKGTIKDPMGMGAYFDIDLPDMPAVTVNLAGGFGRSAVTLRKSSVSIGGNEVTVSGSLDWGGAKPVIGLTLKSKNIVLETIFPNIYKPGPKWVRPERPLNVFKDVPLYSEKLHDYDADIAIDIDRLRIFKELTVNNLDITGHLKDGGVQISSHATFADGDVRVGIKAHDVEGVLAVQSAAAASGVVVGKILESVGSKDFLAELPVNVDYYLEGAGENLAELVSNTWGPVKIYSVGKGYAYSDLVAYLYGQDFITSLRHTITDMFRSREKYDQMSVSCATVNLKVRAGRVETEKGVAVGTNAINIRAKGFVDFGAEQMRVALATVPVRGIKLSISGSVVNSMEVSGSLAEPEISVSGTALMAKAVTATGIGLLLAPFTGGLSVVAGAGLGLLAGDLLENWLSDGMPCETARNEGAPVVEGDPAFLSLPFSVLSDGLIN